ncbi:MAG: energy-coupled thiamine transporter ThiT [Firmicutes bacterium]|nr:energy-coupled thiamine transporter ThiT [Bacillota bacterium]
MASAVYSLSYNGSYMLPEIIITAVVACILEKALHFSTWSEK